MNVFQVQAMFTGLGERGLLASPSLEEAQQVLSGGYWLSLADVSVEAALRASAFELTVAVRNIGTDPLPVGIGWHLYFAIPSGQREQARIHLPAHQRALVNDYDDEFPTGQIVDVAGTPYDFTSPSGAPLGTR